MLASHVMLMLDSPVNVTRDTTNDFRAVAVDRTKEEKETNGHLSDDDYEQFGGLFFSFQFNSSKTFFIKNWPSSASFSFIFGLFQQTMQNLQQIIVINVHSVSVAGIRTHNLLL